MSTPKKYFHDHFVLLLVSVNSFLTIAVVIFVLVRIIGFNHGNGFIVQYRPSLGVNSYQTGSVLQLIAFAIYAPLILAINFVLSYRVYKIHRQLAVTILSLGILLLTLSIIIANALLLLR